MDGFPDGRPPAFPPTSETPYHGATRRLEETIEEDEE
jgi:hypothetical protein